MAVRYRDTKTGRLVSKSTWTRSKAHGGTRYKRERREKKVEEEPRRKRPREPELSEAELEELIEEQIEEEEEEYTGAFDTP